MRLHRSIPTSILGNAFKVALIVGTLLNFVNHGQALVYGKDVEWGRILLNYCIPFGVSAYSAARISARPVPKRMRRTHD